MSSKLKVYLLVYTLKDEEGTYSCQMIAKDPSTARHRVKKTLRLDHETEIDQFLECKVSPILKERLIIVDSYLGTICPSQNE